MRKSLSIILVFVFAISIFVFESCVKKQDNAVKIGVIIPLSVQWSDYGEQMKNGIDLWIKNNPDSKVKIIYEDGEALPKKSVSAFNLLISKDIKALITGFSGVVLSLAPIAERNSIPLLNGGATNPNIKKSGSYIFNVVPDAEIEASFIATFLKDSLNLKNCFIYWQNNDAGKGMKDFFKNKYIEIGGHIIGELSHNIDQQDYKNDLSQIKSKDPKVIFVPTYSKDLGLIIKQATDIGIKDVLWVGYAATETKDVINIAAERLNGKLIYSYYSFDIENQQDEKMKKFVIDFQKEYQQQPGLYSATFYDAISIIDSAIKSDKNIKDYIYGLNIFNGVSGKLRFNHRNYITSGMKMKIIYDNQFKNFNKNYLNVHGIANE